MLLRQIEVSMAQGKSALVACRDAGVAAELRDELQNGKIFYSLKEAKIVIEQWRRYQTALGAQLQAAGPADDCPSR